MTDLIVQTEYFRYPGRLALQSGAALDGFSLAYETYGRLNAERSNAILICHAWSGDAHVAGRYNAGEDKPGWWDELVGPGKGLDTNKYFVICANVLGGCQGTTGPCLVDPATETHYGPSFPFITVGYMVQVHTPLVCALGIA